MKLNLKLAKRLFLCVTPLATGSVFVTLPTFAATLATSEARVNFSNFSYNPLDIAILTGTKTNTLATDGEVSAKADAEAAILVDSSAPQTKGYNTSLSTVQGDGQNYQGQAQSVAGLIGYNFLVDAGGTFSFNFDTLLNLQTSVDYASENADAAGNISFFLYDNTDSNNPPVLLDFFTLIGQVNTAQSDDFLIFDKSASLTSNPEGNNFNTSFGGNQESALASIKGWFSRTFHKFTSLVLVEGKDNKASTCSWH